MLEYCWQETKQKIYEKRIEREAIYRSEGLCVVRDLDHCL